MLIEELSTLLQQPLNPNRVENPVRCPLHDDKVASMSINIRKGVWNCQGCGKAGTLRTLAQFLGGDLDPADIALATANIEPDEEPIDFTDKYNEFKPLAPVTAAGVRYGREKGIYFATLTAFGIRHDGRGTLCMPYFDGDRVVALRYRGRDNFKWFEEGSERTIYNLNAVRGSNRVVLAEGESDAHAIHTALLHTPGIAVGGIPGANSSVERWELWALDLMWADVVYIAYDADEAGDKGAERAIEVLGPIARRLRPTRGNDWSEAIAAGETPQLV